MSDPRYIDAILRARLCAHVIRRIKAIADPSMRERERLEMYVERRRIWSRYAESLRRYVAK